MREPWLESGRLLDAIERELRALDLWEAVPPAPAALESGQPFCYDTLEANQWLQWVFLPRMRALIAAGAPLPTTCHVAEYLEEFYRESGLPVVGLIRAVRAIDQLLSAPRLA